MKILVAGATGAIGRSLVLMLVKEGHEVVALTRDPQKFDGVEAMGAEPVLGDVFDVARLNEIAGRAAPEVIIHSSRVLVRRQKIPWRRPIGCASKWSCPALVDGFPLTFQAI